MRLDLPALTGPARTTVTPSRQQRVRSNPASREATAAFTSAMAERKPSCGRHSTCLLYTSGSGSSQGESTLRRFDAQVRKAFPDVSVRWAFTSMLMRERLASERKKSDSVHKALKKMAFEKFTHVAVQPVHVIPGLEYGDIGSDADERRADGTFASLLVGAPLLTESQEMCIRDRSSRNRK